VPRSKTAKGASDDGALTAAEASFVSEYLVDFNPVQAAIRAGVKRLNAENVSDNYLNSGRVAREIQRRIDDSELEELVSFNRMFAALWREANDERNKDATRVSAISKLAELKKEMKAAQKGGASGVMLVPMTMSADAWEKTAVAAQAKLMGRR
jgi:phage terminase small subunit